MIPLEPELLHEPQVMVEIGPVAKRIMAVEAELLADLIVMGKEMSSRRKCLEEPEGYELSGC